MAILTTVPYEELRTSGDMSINKEGMRGTRIFEVSWSNRETFAADLLRYPANFWPGIPALRCSGVQMTGKGVHSYDAVKDMIAYEFCDVVAEYTTPESDEKGDGTRRTDELDIGGQFITCGKGTFRWASDNAVIEEAPGKYVGTIGYTVDIEGATSFPLAAMVAAAGRVNSSAFMGVAEGSVLYEGAKLRHTIDQDGNRTYSIAHKLQMRSVPWNYLLRPSTGAWEEVTPPIYDSYNLNAVIPP